MQTEPPNNKKSAHAEREERILAYWKEKGIFEKSLAQNEHSKKEFIFYEGPPTANGRPGIHHMEARAFKDAIPRYKTMQGFKMRRKGGWDTHGLPVELQVEKELGLKSKKDIEAYGVAQFNEKCKQSVWTYVKEWEEFSRRMGYWVDMQNAYVTYKPNYIESLWNIVKHVDSRKLLYKDYKVVPWCPRCGTGLSSHELAQGYETVKDLSVTVEFRVKNQPKTSILAWTTTPWTLPGNVALAVNADIEYVEIEKKDEGAGELVHFVLAKARLAAVFKDDQFTVVKTFKGSDLVGWEYEPLYPFMRDHVSAGEQPKMKNAYKVYAADFVTTTDGTGVVHTAVMYGQDDFELGTKVGLPKHHLVHDDGTFKKETGFLAGLFVKDENTAVTIIKDLAARGLLFAKEKYEHTYPFCWRCKTPLIYFARDSWYIQMSALRKDLVKENEGIHWEPEHIKEGRFGEWLREIKDWAISRERYWGTPLPVWSCHKCHQRKVIGSVAEITRTPKNQYWVMRHGESESNALGVLNGGDRELYHLTDAGKAAVKESIKALHKKKIDLVFVSPFLRARETAEIVREALHLKKDQIVVEERLHEVNFGDYEGKKAEDFFKAFPWPERFDRAPEGAEKYGDVKKRVGAFLYEVDKKHSGRNILFISHGTPAMMLRSAAMGLDRKQSIDLEMADYIDKAQIQKVDFRLIPHNAEFELDLHRPFIDEVKLPCLCGTEMVRVKEVMDVWFDSGAMPFAQDHYPFDFKTGFLGFGGDKLLYPADFIAEAIDQTRGWFYTLHAVGVLMGKGKAFKNAICLGHILDAQGKKMSKSIGNIVNPWEMMDLYGADAIRFWMYSINQPGESKNFDPKTVDEIVKKVFNLAANTATFYKTYGTKDVKAADDSDNVLDIWILSRLNEVVANVTKNLDAYVLMEPARAIRDFVGDLSQWYLRRSRDRFKEEGNDKLLAMQTTKHVLLTLSKLLAPFTPFFAEELYRDVGGELESVHLEPWPKAGKIDTENLKSMEVVRELSSAGLEARNTAKINVRQPLANLFVRDEKVSRLAPEFIEVIQDEVNVRAVTFDALRKNNAELDLNITPELKEEGELRELLRKIQDLRKEKGLSVGDSAVLVATEDLRALISKNEAQIKKATSLGSIEYGATFALR